MPTLNWIGKEAVVNHHHQVPFHLLKDVPDLACGEPGDGNLIVQGDNLVALKALLPTHAGKVKCIYIDPPYNTGNEGWVYNDNLTQPQFKEWIGQTVGKEGEDFSRHGREEPRIPIFMYRLGSISPQRMSESKKPGGKPLPSLHSATYLPEPTVTLRTGVTTMTAAAIDLLQ